MGVLGWFSRQKSLKVPARCPYCMGRLPPGGGACPVCGQNPAAYQPSANQLPPGTVLQGHYQLGKALGAGGFGITYLAWDSVLDRRVAVKEYFPQQMVWRVSASNLDVSRHMNVKEEDYQESKKGFLREARTLSHMGNIPGIVQVYSFFEAHNTAYLVMEFLEGETFAQMVKRRGALPMGEVLRLLKPVFEALEEVHRAGTIHRDISPDNLMVLKSGAAKVMDFGAAREIDGERTMTNILRHGYAPPEQYTGHNQGAWTDVYALCTVIYYCLTGQAPPISLERYDDNDPLRPPHTLGAVISGEQEAALLKGLAVRTDQRWKSMSELYAVLYNPWRDNVLMEDWEKGRDPWDYSDYPVFGSKILRKEVSSVTFLDTTVNAPRNTWDVSQKKNRSVLAWATEERELYHLFIAGNGGVAAPVNSYVLFAGYSNVKQIHFNGVFHTESVTDMNGMFCGCDGLKALDVSGFDTSNVMYMSWMFCNCGGLKALDVSGFDTSNVMYMSRMFFDCGGLKALDLSGFETSKVTDMGCMFHDCRSLTALDVSGFDTSNVTNMNSMFYACSGLKTLDVSGFDTSQVTDMSWMFYDCGGLKALDVSNFDTSNVMYMMGMFHGCGGLKALNVSNFDTSNVTDMMAMFYDCGGLKALDLSGFDTSQVTDMSWMFYDCGGLKALDVSGFNISGVESMEGMFYDCGSLTTVYASERFVPNRFLDDDCFDGCTSLVGGNGTAYSVEHTDTEYARIDKPGQPGYFTAKR